MVSNLIDQEWVMRMRANLVFNAAILHSGHCFHLYCQLGFHFYGMIFCLSAIPDYRKLVGLNAYVLAIN